MAFNKEEYWLRRQNIEKIKVPTGEIVNDKPKTKTVKRAAPLRGQGDNPDLAQMFKFEAPKGNQPRSGRRQGMRTTVVPDYKLCSEDRCMNNAERDNLCMSHWKFYFADLSNHQRMKAKEQLRQLRARVKNFEQEPKNAAAN